MNRRAWIAAFLLWACAPCCQALAQTSGTLVSSPAYEASRVLKNSPGNLSWLTITTSSAAGYLMLFDATSAPSDGAVAPVYCVPVAAVSGNPLSWMGAPPHFAVGIVAVFSTTGCYTKTGSATAAFFAQVF